MLAVDWVSLTTGIASPKSLNVCTLLKGLVGLWEALVASAVHFLGSEQCFMRHILLKGQLQGWLEWAEHCVIAGCEQGRGCFAFINSSFPITKCSSYLKGSCNGEYLRYFLILEL